MKIYLVLLFMTLLNYGAFAQVTGEVNVLDRDVFYLHYTPETAISDDIDYQKWTTKVGLPPLRLGKLSLFNTLGLDRHQFEYNATTAALDTRNLETFYNANYSLFATYKLSDKWSLNTLLTPFAISNFEEDFSFDEVEFNGNLFLERTFYRRNGGYFQIGLGVGYMTLNGTTQLTPISQIKARLNEKWSFVLGLPNTYVKYDFHPSHSIKLLGDLNDFSARLNGSGSVLTGAEVENAVFTTISGGLEYNFWITKSFGLMAKGTYPVWGDYELRDDDNDPSFEFDTSFSQPFFSIGIKFNPIRSLQNSLKPL